MGEGAATPQLEEVAGVEREPGKSPAPEAATLVGAAGAGAAAADAERAPHGAAAEGGCSPAPPCAPAAGIESIDHDTTCYLRANLGVDRRTFLGLPAEIRRDLVRPGRRHAREPVVPATIDPAIARPMQQRSYSRPSNSTMDDSVSN